MDKSLASDKFHDDYMINDFYKMVTPRNISKSVPSLIIELFRPSSVDYIARNRTSQTKVFQFSKYPQFIDSGL